MIAETVNDTASKGERRAHDLNPIPRSSERERMLVDFENFGRVKLSWHGKFDEISKESFSHEDVYSSENHAYEGIWGNTGCEKSLVCAGTAWARPREANKLQIVFQERQHFRLGKKYFAAKWGGNSQRKRCRPLSRKPQY